MANSRQQWHHSQHGSQPSRAGRRTAAKRCPQGAAFGKGHGDGQGANSHPATHSPATHSAGAARLGANNRPFQWASSIRTVRSPGEEQSLRLGWWHKACNARHRATLARRQSKQQCQPAPGTPSAPFGALCVLPPAHLSPIPYTASQPHCRSSLLQQCPAGKWGLSPPALRGSWHRGARAEPELC